MSRCTSWLGHKFVPRYSTTHTETSFSKKIGGDVISLAQLTGPLGIERNKLVLINHIYQGDICVRCGIDAKPSSTPPTGGTT